jgi:hypothetical protein
MWESKEKPELVADTKGDLKHELCCNKVPSSDFNTTKIMFLMRFWSLCIGICENEWTTTKQRQRHDLHDRIAARDYMKFLCLPLREVFWVRIGNDTICMIDCCQRLHEVPLSAITRSVLGYILTIAAATTSVLATGISFYLCTQIGKHKVMDMTQMNINK